VSVTDRPPDRSRRAPLRAGLLAGAAVVVVAFGLTIAFGAGGGPPATSSPRADATSALGDLSLVPVTIGPSPSAAATSGEPSPSAGVSSSPAASPTTAGAVRATRIRVARLGIDLAIVEGDGIDAPLGRAAHYPGSAWPGGGSNIYLYGHARDGMFIDLWKARAGDVVELDLVDGTSRRYVVDEVLPRVPWNAVRYLEPTPGEQLTLQTSTSYYATAPRFIVIALPAP
jgi:LPXTG-site transpeptidase (sortase) family protein